MTNEARRATQGEQIEGPCTTTCEWGRREACTQRRHPPLRVWIASSEAWVRRPSPDNALSFLTGRHMSAMIIEPVCTAGLWASRKLTRLEAHKHYVPLGVGRRKERCNGAQTHMYMNRRGAKLEGQAPSRWHATTRCHLTSADADARQIDGVGRDHPHCMA